MVNLLRKLFIKNYQKVDDSEVRAKHGILAAVGGIFINILLFLFKLIIGLLTGSISIVSDSFNNLSDLFSCFVNLIGFKLAKKPADYEHPYGHARIEYIAGMIVSFIILAIGALLLIESSKKLMVGSATLTFSYYVYIILGFSILMKILLVIFYRKIGKIINSVTLKASMSDSLNDVITTSVILIAYIIQSVFPNLWYLDSVLSILVALLIIYNGIKMIKETASPLIGGSVDSELIKNIVKDIKNHKEVLGVHDILSHTYGPNNIYISLHVEVDGYQNVFVSHDLIENIENEINEKYHVKTLIHMDPIDTKSEEIKTLKPFIEEEINKFDKRISFHDLRLVKGPTHTNVIFDILVPLEDAFVDEMVKILKEKITKLDPKYRVIINIDYDLSNGKEKTNNFGD